MYEKAQHRLRTSSTGPKKQGKGYTLSPARYMYYNLLKLGDADASNKTGRIFEEHDLRKTMKVYTKVHILVTKTTLNFKSISTGFIKPGDGSIPQNP